MSGGKIEQFPKPGMEQKVHYKNWDIHLQTALLLIILHLAFLIVMVDGVRSEDVEDPAAGRDTSDQREDMDCDYGDRDEEDIGNLK